MSRPRVSLGLHEEVALLALRNDRGTVAGGVMYAQAAGGALLAELLLTGRLRAVTEGRSTYAVPGNASKTGDDVLDECLDRVRAARRRGKLVSWVQRFGSLRKLHHRVASGLVKKGVLRESQDRVLLIFQRRIYPELDPAVEQAIIARLDRAIFSDTATVDERTMLLIAVSHHAGLLRTNFDKKRLKARRARIDAIIKGDAVGKATKQAIEATQAAVMAATISATVAATAATASG